MGNLGPLPIPPNTNQLHRVPAWTVGAQFWLLPQSQYLCREHSAREEELGVVLQLLFTH